MSGAAESNERRHSCGQCGMLVPSQRPVFHPHVYCMLYKAGVRDPERYMEATFPLLREHFAPLTERLRQRHAEGESMRSLARHYGITRERVRQIVMVPAADLDKWEKDAREGRVYAVTSEFRLLTLIEAVRAGRVPSPSGEGTAPGETP